MLHFRSIINNIHEQWEIQSYYKDDQHYVFNYHYSGQGSGTGDGTIKIPVKYVKENKGSVYLLPEVLFAHIFTTKSYFKDVNLDEIVNKASSDRPLYYMTLNVKKDTAGDDEDTAGDDVKLSQTVYKVADGFKRLMDNTRTNGTNPEDGTNPEELTKVPRFSTFSYYKQYLINKI
jgi:hypothetical protein|tara:strand:- start:777 stop:1301 length:525 start_codon:yes stop_codon:yes gene_type:complete